MRKAAQVNIHAVAKVCSCVHADRDRKIADR